LNELKKELILQPQRKRWRMAGAMIKDEGWQWRKIRMALFEKNRKICRLFLVFFVLVGLCAS
jgi:hypothetical protein